MRKDMHHLPRVRSIDSFSDRKLLTRGPLPRDMEEMATHQSMRSSVPHYSYPSITGVKPVIRWLRQQAGRSWDSVYAELRKQFDVRSGTNSLVLERVLREVDMKVEFRDGEPWVAGRWGGYRVDGLYVDPETRILKLVDLSVGAAHRRAAANQAHKAKRLATRVDVKDNLQLHNIKGLWFWVELAPIQEPTYRTTKTYTLRDGTVIGGHRFLDYSTVCRDVITGQDFMKLPKNSWERHPLQDKYGKPDHYAKRKWQASREDVVKFVPTNLKAAA